MYTSTESPMTFPSDIAGSYAHAVTEVQAEDTTGDAQTDIRHELIRAQCKLTERQLADGQRRWHRLQKEGGAFNQARAAASTHRLATLSGQTRPSLRQMLSGDIDTEFDPAAIAAPMSAVCPAVPRRPSFGRHAQVGLASQNWAREPVNGEQPLLVIFAMVGDIPIVRPRSGGAWHLLPESGYALCLKPTELSIAIAPRVLDVSPETGRAHARAPVFKFRDAKEVSDLHFIPIDGAWYAIEDPMAPFAHVYNPLVDSLPSRAVESVDGEWRFKRHCLYGVNGVTGREDSDGVIRMNGKQFVKLEAMMVEVDAVGSIEVGEWWELPSHSPDLSCLRARPYANAQPGANSSSNGSDTSTPASRDDAPFLQF